MRTVAIFLLAVLLRLPSPAMAAQDVEGPWRTRHEAGLRALAEGRFEEAAGSFRAAVREAEELGSENFRLGESLGALAEAVRRSGDYVEAEAHALRSLAILQRILHPQDPVIAVHRNNLAETYWQLGRPEDAEPQYRQSLPILEAALGPGHPDVVRSVERLAARALVRDDPAEAVRFYERLLAARWGGGQSAFVELVDHLSALVVLAHFPDADREAAARRFFDTLGSVRPSPAAYVALSRLLFRQQRVDASERVMRLAVEAFPDSRGIRMELAELYAENSRLRSALETFDEALRIETAPDADLRRRARLHVRVGHMHIELGQFDEAARAFGRALEIAPDAMEARLELAGQYLVRDMLDEAQDEYGRVVAARPGSADAHYGLAELYLRQGRFDEAAAAASLAIEADPEHQRARYTRVRALARGGRAEEGRRELAEYQRREAEAAEADDREVRESAINRSGAAALVEGRPEDAIALFREGIAAYPDAALIYLNLGTALSKVGRREAAVATFQAMLDRGCCPLGDSYLVHRSLASEFEVMGDDRSIRHRAFYLRELDLALAAAIEPR